MNNLSPESKQLLKGIAREAEGWNGDWIPCDLDSSQRGNLTDLKKKGLAETWDDGEQNWLKLTKTGYTTLEK